MPTFSQKDALDILSRPARALNLSSDYYKAVFCLSKYPSSETEEALISFLKLPNDDQPIKIAQRKAIEVLGLLNCQKAIPIIGKYLNSDDSYTVENAAYSLQLLNCSDKKIHSIISSLLDKPGQNKRVLIQSLARLGVDDQIKKIKYFIDKKTYKNNIYGAAIAAFTKLSGDSKYINNLQNILLSSNQIDRQLAVQDVIDSGSIEMLPYVINSPISPFFKMRAISSLWPIDKENTINLNLFNVIDNLIIDDPKNIYLLHHYDEKKSIDFLISQFFNTDFSRSYLALKTIRKENLNEVWKVLPKYFPAIKKDYGALYLLINLFHGIPIYGKEIIEQIEEILYYSISSHWPEFIKFRPLAMKLLLRLKPFECRKQLTKWLDSSQTPYWVSRYAILMQIEEFLLNDHTIDFSIDYRKIIKDENRFVSAKAKSICMKLEF